MSDEKEEMGFRVTAGRLAFFLSLLTAATLLFGGAKVVFDAGYRMQDLERNDARQDARDEKFAAQLTKFSDSLNAFNLTQHELRILIQEMKNEQP